MELIGWDVGVILTTNTRWVFEDQVKMHPGSLAYYEHHKDWHAKGNKGGHVCDNQDHAMEFAQEMLRDWFQSDKDKVCDFFNKVAALDIKVPQVTDIRRVLMHMGFTAEDEARIKGLANASATSGVKDLIDAFKAAGWDVEVESINLDDFLKGKR
jgi:hypothetical protein